MEKPVIFALTPRAGRWNHRYLAPTHFAWSQQMLSRLGDEAQKQTSDPNSLRASRQASQQTTGRVGSEYLVVRDERLTTLTDRERRSLEDELRQQLLSLDELISGQIDWEQESGLVVRHSRIDELQEHWEQRLRSLSSKPPGVRAGRFWRPRLALCVIALVAAVLFLAQIGQQHLRQKARNSEEFRLEEFIHQLTGMMAPNDGRTRDPGSVVHRLATDLFGGTFSKPSGRERQVHETENSRDGLTLILEDRKLLQDTLLRFYGLAFDKADPSLGLDQLTSDQSVLAKLRQLYVNGHLNPIGLLQAKTDAQAKVAADLGRIAPAGFREVIDHLQRLRDAVSRSHLSRRPLDTSSEDLYEKWFRKVMEVEPAAVSSVVVPVGKSMPNFYVCSDLKAAMWLFSLLGTPETGALSEPSAGQQGLLTLICWFGGQYQKDKALLSRERIQDRIKAHADNPEPRLLFERLAHLVEACSRVE